MTEQSIDSAAFQNAQLRSERYRIIAVVAFVSFFTAVVALRIVIYGSKMSPWGIAALVLLIAYEFVGLRTVDRCLRQGKKLRPGLWLLTVLLESSFPAIGIAFLSSPRLEPSYRPLATPWVLAFFPFLILSVLRLSPRACRFAGCITAFSYLAAAFYLDWRPSFHGLSNHSVTQTAVGFYAIVLLASGFIAAAVAGEILKYVQAALQEAETKQQLAQVQHDLDIVNPSQEQFGFDRLVSMIRKHSHLPPEEIIAEIYQAVLDFAGGTKQKDDLTAVLIKRAAC